VSPSSRSKRPRRISSKQRLNESRIYPHGIPRAYQGSLPTGSRLRSRGLASVCSDAARLRYSRRSSASGKMEMVVGFQSCCPARFAQLPGHLAVRLAFSALPRKYINWRLLNGCSKHSISCICSVQNAKGSSVGANFLREADSDGIRCWSRLRHPCLVNASQMQWLGGLQLQGWHLDHMFRIEEMRGVSSI
jgi:hypothetical protein